jgi:alanine racemase
VSDTREIRPDSEARRAEALIDAGAIEANARTLRRIAGTALMAVVKADGYGHGALTAARAALAGGADQLGVAFPSEALQLRAAGIDAPILAWLWVPGEDVGPAVAAGVTLGVSSEAHLQRVLTAGGRPEIHLKADTGLGRGGATVAQWRGLVDAAARAEAAGAVRVAGLMSHFASSEVSDDPSIDDQLALFRDAIRVATGAGLRPDVLHLANTAAALDIPAARFDAVRCGIGLFGLDPTLRRDHGLQPAMTLRATVALTKKVPAGSGVSYNLTYRTPEATTLALVPLGYGDGIPRAASSRATVWVNGKQFRIAGRVAMDQFVIDVGGEAVTAGDEVLVFGDGGRGEPTAADWAAACDTIDYEIVTRIGPRVPRVTAGARS